MRGEREGPERGQRGRKEGGARERRLEAKGMEICRRERSAQAEVGEGSSEVRTEACCSVYQFGDATSSIFSVPPWETGAW